MLPLVLPSIFSMWKHRLVFRFSLREKRKHPKANNKAKPKMMHPNELTLYRQHSERCTRFSQMPNGRFQTSKGPKSKRPTTKEPDGAEEILLDGKCQGVCPIYCYGWLNDTYVKPERVVNKGQAVKTWQDARIVRNKRVAEADKGVVNHYDEDEEERKIAKATVEEAVEYYMNRRFPEAKAGETPKWKNNTRKAYRNLLHNRMLPFAAGHHPPIRLFRKNFSEPGVADEFYDSWRIVKTVKNGMAPGDQLDESTIISNLITFKKFTTDMKRWKWLTQDSAQHIPMPAPPTMMTQFGRRVRRQKHGMSLQEYDRLINTKLESRFAETLEGKRTISRIMELRYPPVNSSRLNIKEIAQKLNDEGFLNKHKRKWNFVSVYKVIQTGTVEQVGISAEQEEEAMTAIILMREGGMRKVDAHDWGGPLG